MKFIINILYLLLISLLISFSNQSLEEVKVTAKTGIIKKELDSSKSKLTFYIDCMVNKNISNNITSINIQLKVKTPDINDPLIAICNIIPVRVIEEEALTSLFCIMNFSRDSDNIDEETNLMIEDGPKLENSEDANKVKFNFEDFEKISTTINIEELTLNYLEDDYCSNNHFLFEMTSSEITQKPLLSTICKIKLSDDEAHPEARCAIPIKGTKIKCFVDVSQAKYVQNDNIIIKAQNLVPCENGQNIEIPDATNKLTIKEECGEIINNKNEFFYINKIITFLLLLITF